MEKMVHQTDEIVSEERKVIGTRLQEIIKALERKASTFYEKTQLNRIYISQITTGTKDVSGRVIEKMVKAYPKVNIYWLFTGLGNMFLTDMQLGISSVVEEPAAGYFSVSDRLQALEERVQFLESLLPKNAK